MVSVVNQIGGVPWALSGLPGEPPAEIAQWAAEERRNAPTPVAAAATDAAGDDDAGSDSWATRRWLVLAFVAAVVGVVFVHRVNRDS